MKKTDLYKGLVGKKVHVKMRERSYYGTLSSQSTFKNIVLKNYHLHRGPYDNSYGKIILIPMSKISSIEVV